MIVREEDGAAVGACDEPERNGVNYFAVAEIDALARAEAAPLKTKGGLTDGQLVSRVFRLLDAGKNLRDIVTELEEAPDRIHTPVGQRGSPARRTPRTRRAR